MIVFLQQSPPMKEEIVVFGGEATAHLCVHNEQNSPPVIRPFLEFEEPLWIQGELMLQDVTIKLGNFSSGAFENPVLMDYFLRMQFEVYGCEIDEMEKQMKISEQCSIGWTASSLNCYNIFNLDDRIDFDGAKDFCSKHGGTLMIPRNNEEENLVLEMTKENSSEHIESFIGRA